MAYEIFPLIFGPFPFSFSVAARRKPGCVRIPTQIGHDSNLIRTAFQSISDTVPIQFGQCSGL